MSGLGPWHTDDFDSMSWHDVHVHGIRFSAFNEDEGAADIILDIDYILKWEQSNNAFLFTVCPAELRFHDACQLRLELDYLSASAGMCPFMIDGIHRELREFATGFKSFRWHIPISWPRGSMEFEAPRFTQRLVGKPIVHAGQSLTPEQRSVD